MADELLLRVPRTAMVEGIGVIGGTKDLNSAHLNTKDDGETREEPAEASGPSNYRATNADLAAALVHILQDSSKLSYLPKLADFEKFHPVSWDPAANEFTERVEKLVENLSCVPREERTCFVAELQDRLWSHRIALEREYRTFKANIWPSVPRESKEPPAFNDYLHARILASSRAMHLWDGATLVPFADFMNYSRVASVLVGCEDDAGSDCVAESLEEEEDGSDSDSEASSDFSTDSAYFRHVESLAAKKSEKSRQGAVRPTSVDPNHRFLAVRAARDLEAGTELVFNYFSYPIPRDRPWAETKDSIISWLIGYGFVPDDS